MNAGKEIQRGVEGEIAAAMSENQRMVDSNVDKVRLRKSNYGLECNAAATYADVYSLKR